MARVNAQESSSRMESQIMESVIVTKWCLIPLKKHRMADVAVMATQGQRASDYYVRAGDNQMVKVITNVKIFDASVNYELTLGVLKEEFEQLWEKALTVSSPDTGLQGFHELAVLGEGSFGKVKLVRETKTGNYFAAKFVLKDLIVKTKQISHIYNEKRVLGSINFPFVVMLEFTRKDYEHVIFGLPFINGGELFTYHRKARRFNENQARFYAAQVFLALEYLHHVKILYRDLKPENILIDTAGYLKITDFGFAKKVENRTATLCGTPEYLAPEVIQSKPYNTGPDWWAFGVLIYELVSGNSPFAEYNDDEMKMYNKICEGTFKLPKSFTDTLKDLIKQLLQVDVTQRLGCMANAQMDIKDHKWFATTDWFAILNRELRPQYVPAVKNMEDLSNFDKYPNKKTKTGKVNKHAELFADF